MCDNNLRISFDYKYPDEAALVVYNTTGGIQNTMDNLSKFETKINNMPNITCAACGSPNVKGHFDPRKRAWIISCPDCGVFMERPDVSEKTDLENEVDILNSYEKLRYQVNKSKEN